MNSLRFNSPKVQPPESERRNWISRLGEQLRSLLPDPDPGENLEEATQHAFGFLESDFGFDKILLAGDQNAVSGRWHREDLSIVIAADRQKETRVAIHWQTPEKTLIPLDLVPIVLFLQNGTLSRMNPDERLRSLKSMRRGTAEQLLERQAKWLREYSARILSDDRSVFTEVCREYRETSGA